MNKIPAGVPQGSGCWRAVDTHFQCVGNRDRLVNSGGGQNSWLEPKIMVLRQKGMRSSLKWRGLKISGSCTHEGPVEFRLSKVSWVRVSTVVWFMDAASAVMQTWHGPIMVKLSQGKVKLNPNPSSKLSWEHFGIPLRAGRRGRGRKGGV